MKMTAADYTAHQAKHGRQLVRNMAKPIIPSKPMPEKHGNVRVVVGGIKFDSKREAKRYIELRLMQHSGEITGLKLQEVFVILPSVILKGRKKPDVKYIADFVYYTKKGEFVIEDTKSPHLRKDPYYRLKLHLLKFSMNLDVVEV